MELTERQKNILLAIIEEYMESAKEVGSVQLLDSKDFNVSSATIRNEMVHLMDMGYLDKSHVSSGRMPTDMAFRFYVNEEAVKARPDSVRLVKIKQGIFRERFSPEGLIQSILHILVENSNAAAFVLMDDMSRHYGVSSLMNYEELHNLKSLQRILDLLEDEDLLKSVFSKFDRDEVTVLIGSELGIRDLDDCTMLFTKLRMLDGRAGHMGIVGSRRINYRVAIPVLSAVRDSVQDALKAWN
ncbi:hypothetical protein KC622_01265 [Candidatus Dojkabacteria bacterium]|uniref:Heat-inducible transcription repressor HrcA n=1 Tax=Candidatus Dojkabacteria bacterium TaxID=2099670 RepID=A0A955HYT8_9BACT|nr:hypothetical protein [Candidatus Dojkabacteria bacterium]MCB9790884.1 hypothetical protein [Candidatus Nomurabacteria bacterium]